MDRRTEGPMTQLDGRSDMLLVKLLIAAKNESFCTQVASVMKT